MKLAFLIPHELKELVHQVEKEKSDQLSIFEVSMNESISIANSLTAQAYDAVIARGGTKKLLENLNLDFPIVEIPLTEVDFHHALEKAKSHKEPFAVLLFPNMIQPFMNYTKIKGEEILHKIVQSEEEVGRVIRELTSLGFNTFVGGGVLNTFQPLYPKANFVVLTSSLGSINKAFKEAKNLVRAIHEVKLSRENLHVLMESSREGVFSINRKGMISFFNQKALHFIPILNKRENLLDELFISKDTIEELFLKERIIHNEIFTFNNRQAMVSVYSIPSIGEVEQLMFVLSDLDHVLEMELSLQKKRIKEGHVAKHQFSDILGISSSLKQSVSIAENYANHDSTVLIYGETGTGKEVFAQSIHNASRRREKPFVAVNCAALPESLLEAELFGYGPGAFTGALSQGKKGLFETAQGGTIFLDEISEMKPSLQSRLLRVIEERSVVPLGTREVIPLSVRIIAATNRSLDKMIEEGNFRMDLFYRLHVLSLHLSPLRERPQDIEVLFHFFNKDLAQKMGRNPLKISPEVMNLLKTNQWKGNIRQLKNFTERILVLCQQNELDKEWLDKYVLALNNDHLFSQGTLLEDEEKKLIYKTLEECDGNKTRAAEILGISRSTLWRKIKSDS